MTCSEFDVQLDAWLDGELEPGAAAAMEAHAAGCTRCAVATARRRALHDTTRHSLEWKKAPDLLRAAISAEASAERVRSVKSAMHWRESIVSVVAVAALLVMTVIGTWHIAGHNRRTDEMVDAVLASHMRALIGTHLTDVLSSDQHTVKPWFNGKIDYSPPVPDFAGRGYPLVGGRLDYIGGHEVAALVYSRRQHVIDLYLWPTEPSNEITDGELSQRGYQILRWTDSGYTCWVVSDLGLTELTEFTALVKQSLAIGRQSAEPQ